MNTKQMALACMMLAAGLSLNAAAQGGDKHDGPPGQNRGGERGGPGGGGGPGGAEQMFITRIVNNPKAAQELGLSDAQVKTLRDGMYDLQEQKAKVKADLEIAAIQQARLLTETTIDEKAVMAAVEKTGAVRTEMAKLDIRGLILVHSTLTAEQRQKLREMIHQRMARAEGGRGGPEGRGQRGGPGRGQGGPDMHQRPDGGPGHGPEAGEPPPGDEPPPGEDAP